MSLLFRFLDSENTEFRFNMVIYSTKIPHLPNIDRKIYFEHMKLRIDFKTKKMLNIFFSNYKSCSTFIPNQTKEYMMIATCSLTSDRFCKF